MIFSSKVYDDVRKECLKNKEQECCGFIKDMRVIKCENISPSKVNNFLINPLEIIEVDPDCIYHSHINCSANPSFMDIRSQKEVDIPFLIYSLKNDDFYFLKK
jgi:proteasome lid subunit RPN8/RPN11